MGTIVRAICFFILICSATLQAHCNCSRYELYGEALCFWSATSDDYFTIAGTAHTNEPVGRRLAKQPEFDVGFRVGGNYALCDGCWLLGARWAQIMPRGREEVAVNGPNDGLWLVLTYMDQAQFSNGLYIDAVFSFDTSLDYRAFDIEAARTICSRGCFEAELSFGLRYARIERSANVLHKGDDFSNPNFSTVGLRTKSESYGIGPTVGIDLTLYQFCGYKLVSDAQFGLLFGEGRQQWFNRYGRPPAPVVTNQWIARMLPFAELRIGVRRCFCGSLLIELGYEAIHYSDAVVQPYYYADDQDNANFSELVSVGFAGVYINVGVQF